MLDKTKNLSEHFTLGQLTMTSFNTEDNNEPPLEAVENLIHLCEDWVYLEVKKLRQLSSQTAALYSFN